MLRLSKKADYALMAAIYLARRARQGSASTREIAEHYAMPADLLAKVLQQLARRGVVASHKGVRGGYRLTRTADAISVAEIVEAIDGPLAMTACALGDDRCAQMPTCTVRDPLQRVKERIATALHTISLDDMSRDIASDDRERRTAMVQMTENAAKQIRKMLAKRALGETALRVGVRAGGCSGFEYVFGWERAPGPADSIVEGPDGATVCIDPKSLKLLDGTVLDYDTSLLSKGFVLKNPNATSTCGCGASFSA